MIATDCSFRIGGWHLTRIRVPPATAVAAGMVAGASTSHCRLVIRCGLLAALSTTSTMYDPTRHAPGSLPVPASGLAAASGGPQGDVDAKRSGRGGAPGASSNDRPLSG